VTELPICDPHHHFFPKPARRDPALPPVLGSGYLLQELLDDLDGVNVVKTVVVETYMMNATERDGGPASETELVAALGRDCEERQQANVRVAAGIVGFADLTLGKGVVPVLQAHLAASDRIRGVRHITTWDASGAFFSAGPPHVLLDPRFREGFACLTEHGLTFDALVYHPQLLEVADVAAAFPSTQIILEHTGCPLGLGPYAGERARVFAEWQEGMAALAACPNVAVKLGGMAMPQCGFGWEQRSTPPEPAELAEAMAPYFLSCIDQFGAERCMFESNFPVEKIACSYSALWLAYEQVAADRIDEEKRALFYDTACSTYRV
jgi:L-fuconolactonase